MRKSVTAEEVERYRRQGFLAMEGFLDSAEVAFWRASLESAVAAREKDAGLLPLIAQERWPSEYRFRQHMNLWQTDDTMRSLLFDPRIAEIAATLMGADAVRIWYDQSFIKSPWAAPTPLHQDNPYWAFHDEAALTLWLTLDEVDATNGALIYLPGTHLVKRWSQHDGDGIGDVLDSSPEWADIQPVCVPLPAGSVIWHNGLSVHGSGANMSRAERRALNLAFMPDGARYNGIPNILPDADRYRAGDPLIDDRVNPIVWPHPTSSNGAVRV
jgi:phytanoyl-CoA hydroxylase